MVLGTINGLIVEFTLATLDEILDPFLVYLSPMSVNDSLVKSGDLLFLLL